MSHMTLKGGGGGAVPFGQNCRPIINIMSVVYLFGNNNVLFVCLLVFVCVLVCVCVCVCARVCVYSVTVYTCVCWLWVGVGDGGGGGGC